MNTNSNSILKAIVIAAGVLTCIFGGLSGVMESTAMLAAAFLTFSLYTMGQIILLGTVESLLESTLKKLDQEKETVKRLLSQEKSRHETLINDRFDSFVEEQLKDLKKTTQNEHSQSQKPK